MSLPVGTRVRLLAPITTHGAGTITFVVAGANEVVDGYDRTVEEIGELVGIPLKYALSIRGHVGLPLFATEEQLEVFE